MKFPAELLQQCWFLAGPTASGKSALALSLARRIQGEIVSLDSMAIYRRMDIGTAKPTAAERAEVPHHLLDLVEPSEEFSTAQYLAAAIAVCNDIVACGRVPLFVGGTGLYLRTVLRGVFEGPPADWDFRNKLIEQATGQPEDWLWQQLQVVDPITAQRLHPNDARRLIRALEVFESTGTPPSALHQEVPLPINERPAHVYWLHPPRDWLYERINRRVEQMFVDGFEEEVRALLHEQVPLGRTAAQALGYREMIDWFEGRIASREETVNLIQTRTRQFAKRQHTWFRNLEECCAIQIAGGESTEELCEQILSHSTGE